MRSIVFETSATEPIGTCAIAASANVVTTLGAPAVLCPRMRDVPFRRDEWIWDKAMMMIAAALTGMPTWAADPT